MGIALQDMFKLSNTGHLITFPNNTDEEASKINSQKIEHSGQVATTTQVTFKKFENAE